MNKPCVLVTGTTGFIGRHVTKLMDQQGVSWIPFEGDILFAEDFFQYGDCTDVLHLAAISRAGVDVAEQQRLISTNIIGTHNVLNYAMSGARRVIFASTCSYGNPSFFPISEDVPLVFHDPYSFSKWSSEQSIFALGKFFHLNAMIFRIFNVYGPHQPTGFLVPDIIEKIRLRDCTFHNLSCIRDFIYVEDLASLLVKAVLSPIEGCVVINAGSGRGYSVNEVVETVFELLGERQEIDECGRQAYIRKSIADIRNAKNLLRWQPEFDLKTGLLNVLSGEKH